MLARACTVMARNHCARGRERDAAVGVAARRIELHGEQ